MLFLLFSVPICLLSFYLAYLCYRQARYQHTVALTVVAVFMLLLSLSILGAGYYASVVIEAELASHLLSPTNLIS